MQLPSYDILPITPETWQQVNLSYSDVINGKIYPAEIKLLRPTKWLEDNGMDEVGNKIHLSISEFGVENVSAIIISITATTIDTSQIDLSAMNSRPVIGAFKRYAEEVRTYIFKDANDHIEEITATPKHPFYVKNKSQFVAIEDVSPTDQLINSSGQTVKLICNKNQINHCGKLYNTDGKPVPVYNLEVYKEHVYYVGNGLLVHNSCLGKDSTKSIAKSHGIITHKSRHEEYVYRLDGRDSVDIVKSGGFSAYEGTKIPSNDFPGLSPLEGRAFSSAKITTDMNDSNIADYLWSFPGVSEEASHLYRLNTKNIRWLSIKENIEAKTLGFSKKSLDYGPANHEILLLKDVPLSNIEYYIDNVWISLSGL